MNFFFEVLVGGLLSGLMYSLVALGFVLIYKASAVFNFAQGAMVFFAVLSFVGFTELGLNFWIALPVTMALMVCVGVLTERLVLRPLVGQSEDTLLMATSTTLGISPAIYSKPAVDAVKDFSSVSMFGAVNFFLVTSPSLGVKTVAELIDLVKKNPGKFNYATSGSGSPHHLFMEVFKKETGLNVQHVPYKGSALAVLDIIAGKPEMMFLDFSVAVPNIQGGKVTALGTSAMAQSVLMPGIQPVARTVPGFDWQAWQGVVATAGTPRAIVAKLNAEMQRFQATPEFKEQLVKFGMEPWAPNTPDQFAEIIRTDVGRWATVVKAAGLKVD